LIMMSNSRSDIGYSGYDVKAARVLREQRNREKGVRALSDILKELDIEIKDNKAKQIGR